MNRIIAVGIPSRFGLTGAKTAYKDENILLGEAQALNFVGAGVQATLNAGVLTVQVDGGGGGGSVTVVDNLTSTSTTGALSANQGRVLAENAAQKAPLNNAALTGAPTAPTPALNDSTDRIATMQAVQAVTAGIEGGAVTTANQYTDNAAFVAEDNAKNYADTLVSTLLDDRGNYNPTVTSLYPDASNNGSGVAGAILKGDLWTVSADGTVNGILVTTGDVVRALVNAADAETNTHWAITQNNLIYVPENLDNKSDATDLGGVLASNVLYPTQAAVKAFVEANALTNASTRYIVNAQTGTTYTVLDTDVSSTGRIIVKCTNAAAIAVTLATPSSLNITTGDSVNIRQGGLGVVTVSGALEGSGVFTAQHETKTFIAQISNTWLVVGG